MEHMPHKGTGFMPPKSEQYMFSYIPQSLRGLRYFFVRHGSIGLL